jgi:transposase
VGRHQKKAQRLTAYLVFLDESGFLLIPTVRRTWAPRGQTPLLRHHYRRDKVSAISAVTVSPRRRHCGLYAHFHLANITHVEVAAFLRELLRHLAGPIIVLWDGGAIHRGPAVRALLARHPRLHVEQFPGYAPELNPDELVWSYLKAQLANGRPDAVDELLADLTRVTRRLRRCPALLRAFILGSELPPVFSA